MSWFTDLRDGFELAVGTVGGFLLGGPAGAAIGAGIAEGVNGSLRKRTGDVVAQATGQPTSSDRRDQMNQVNEQIKNYKDQTELTRQSLNEKRDSVVAEKRRVEEKQIRSLRRNYSTQGFLGGNQAPSEPDMSSKLGG